MLKFTIPKIPLAALVSVLAFLVFNVIWLAPYVWLVGADSGVDGMTNQAQHAGIVREIDRNSGRITSLEEFRVEIQRAQLQERMVRSEVNIEMIVRMFWTLLTGMVALIVDAVARHVRDRKAR